MASIEDKHDDSHKYRAKMPFFLHSAQLLPCPFIILTHNSFIQSTFLWWTRCGEKYCDPNHGTETTIFHRIMAWFGWKMAKKCLISRIELKTLMAVQYPVLAATKLDSESNVNRFSAMGKKIGAVFDSMEFCLFYSQLFGIDSTDLAPKMLSNFHCDAMPEALNGLWWFIYSIQN